MNKIPTDELCELTTNIVDYVWAIKHDTPTPPPHTVTEDNGEVHYVKDAQDIYENIYDLIDNYINDDEDTTNWFGYGNEPENWSGYTNKDKE